MDRRHSRRARTKRARAASHAIEREKWKNGEIDQRNSRLPEHWRWPARLLGAAAVPAVAVFGMCSTAGAVASQVAVCSTVRAVPGDTVAGLVYRWGLNWRNMGDVWRVAQDNPSIPDPNRLEVGEVVTDCPGPVAPHASVPTVGHQLTAIETLATVEAAQTGDWHWPIPVWDLAQANPLIGGPYGDLPAGTLVHLLATVAPAAPIIPRTIPAPSPTTVPARTPPYVPTRSVGTATTSSAPTPPTRPAPTPVPPATLPPERPKLVEEPPPTTKAPEPPTTADPPKAHIATVEGPVTFGAEQPAPTTVPAPPPVAVLGMKIHAGYAGPVDPADPKVVAHAFTQLATDDPALTAPAVATLVGGFIAESGLDPTTGQPGGRPGGDGGTAVGIAQWRGSRHCGDSDGLDAQLACAAVELQTHYPTVQAVLSDPKASQGQLDHAEDQYEGEAIVGQRRRYAHGIADQILGGQK